MFTDPSETFEQDRDLRRTAGRWSNRTASGEDLAQEAWLAALERGDTNFRSFGGWMARVARFKFLRSSRRDTLREDAERQAARAVSVPPEDALAARESAALVRDAVRSLREPYRTVVEMRYLEGLSIQEIAKLLGRPPATVKSQLQRALAELREGLGRRETFSWVALWTWWRDRARNTQVRAVAAAGALGTAVAVLLFTTGSERVAANALAATLPAERGSAEVPREAQREAHDARVSVSNAVPESLDGIAPESEASAARRRVRGRVLDSISSAPVAGATIWTTFPGDPERALRVGESDDDGNFELSLGEASVWIGARASGAFPSHWVAPDTPGMSEDVALEVTRAERWTERFVRDFAGRRIEGATIRSCPAYDVKAWSRADATWCFGRLVSEVETDAQGRFRWPLSPGTRRVVVSAPGCAPWAGLLRGSGEGTDIVLDAESRLFGHVTDSAGNPVQGARIEVTPQNDHPIRSVEAGSDGRFEVDGLAQGTVHVTATAMRFGRSISESTQVVVPSKVDLRLSDESSIHGRVSSEQGSGLVGWTVVLREAEGPRRRSSRLTATARLNEVTTDGAGAFAFPVRDDVPYSLFVRAPGERQAQWACSQVTAGSDVELVPDLESFTVHGQLTEPPGPNVEVFLAGDRLLDDRIAPVDPRTGSFAIDKVPSGSFELYVWTPGRPPSLCRRVEVAGSSVRLGAIAPLRHGRISFEVVSKAGEPVVPDDLVVLTAPDDFRVLALQDGEGHGFTCSEDGVWQTLDLPEGLYRLQLQIHGLTPQTWPLHVRADCETHLVAVMDPAVRRR